MFPRLSLHRSDPCTGSKHNEPCPTFAAQYAAQKSGGTRCFREVPAIPTNSAKDHQFVGVITLRGTQTGAALGPPPSHPIPRCLSQFRDAVLRLGRVLATAIVGKVVLHQRVPHRAGATCSHQVLFSYCREAVSGGFQEYYGQWPKPGMNEKREFYHYLCTAEMRLPGQFTAGTAGMFAIYSQAPTTTKLSRYLWSGLFFSRGPVAVRGEKG